jgi:DNA-binding response OmpR family regulator
MLPGMDGISLCKAIRLKTDIPILMLTAKDDYVDKVLALELGADDYMTKPFNTRELIARVKAICRRLDKKAHDDRIIEFGNLKLNLMERTLYRDNTEIILTSKEFDILKLLITSPGRVYPREELYQLVWNEDVLDTRTVDVHISNLRDKIEDDPFSPSYIKTKWGVGYYFRKERV